MSAGSVARLQGAPEVSALASLRHHHPEELEELLPPPQVSGRYDHPDGLERVQREEPLLHGTQCSRTATGGQPRIPGSTQVSETSRGEEMMRDLLKKLTA